MSGQGQAEQTARQMAGDGKFPNKYWVSASSDWSIAKPGELVSASEVYKDIQEAYTIQGPFPTFAEAMQAAESLAQECVEPTEDGYHSVRIEDRLSGQVYEGQYIEYTVQKGRYTMTKFEWEWYDDTRFTKQTMEAKGKVFA